MNRSKGNFERLRVSFSRCKNCVTERGCNRFLGAEGMGLQNHCKKDGGKDLLVLMNEKNWRKAKNLVLLALASYKPATKDEAVALGEHETSKTEGEE